MKIKLSANMREGSGPVFDKALEESHVRAACTSLWRSKEVRGERDGAGE